MDDSQAYQGSYYSRTVEISPEQFNTLQTFANDPSTGGFNASTYNALTNNCIDFVWAALSTIGISRPGLSSPQEGQIPLDGWIPVANGPVLADALSDFQNGPSAPPPDQSIPPPPPGTFTIGGRHRRGAHRRAILRPHQSVRAHPANLPATLATAMPRSARWFSI
jgi:hypothetical protein